MIINTGGRTDTVQYYSEWLLNRFKEGFVYSRTVLYAIYRHETIRFNALQKYLNLLSHKTLSNTLKELEQDDLIIKHDYKEIPPKVEYSLSDKGKSFIPILYAMCDWGEKFIK